MTLICGIDEAGRGPVIGPMVMAGVLIDNKDEKKLKAIGVKDSKQLTPDQRERLAEEIKKIAKKIRIVIIEPKVIDFHVMGESSNLNWLEADKTIEIIDSLKPDAVYIDCPSNNTTAYKNYFAKKIKSDIKMYAEHKADQKYPVVSAASIIAKVTRDAEIEKIKAKIGVDFGSGYPSDPRTTKFLEDNWQKYPDIFRKSWGTYKEFANAEGQKKLGEFR